MKWIKKVFLQKYILKSKYLIFWLRSNNVPNFGIEITTYFLQYDLLAWFANVSHKHKDVQHNISCHVATRGSRNSLASLKLSRQLETES
jgi:hypothetical protein